MSLPGKSYSPRVSWPIVAGTLWLVSFTVHAQSGSLPPSQMSQSQELPAGAGTDTVRTRCLVCHGADLILQQRLSRDGWTREVDKMIGWGAVFDASEKSTIIEYLARQFGPALAERIPDGPGLGTTLVKTRCLTCHDRRLIEQQRLDAAGWGRVVDKMIGWGATLSAAERDTLLDHFVSVWAR